MNVDKIKSEILKPGLVNNLLIKIRREFYGL